MRKSKFRGKNQLNFREKIEKKSSYGNNLEIFKNFMKYNFKRNVQLQSKYRHMN